MDSISGIIWVRIGPSITSTLALVNVPNAHDTAGFTFVTVKSSGLSVLMTALPHMPK